MASGCACALGRAAPSWRHDAGRAASALASEPLEAGVVMLPAGARMRRGVDFTAATRAGSRAGRPLVTGHLLVRRDDPAPPLVGFVVSKKVGSAVVRNRLRRSLRVLRAAPSAAGACQADLAADVSLVIRVLLRRQGG